MRKNLLWKYLPLLVILLIASLEYVLLLRHKSAYVSDSYFYNHVYYQIQGNPYSTAKNKVINKLEGKKLDEIESKIFYDSNNYEYSLSRYERRPLYPFSASVLNLVTRNEYISFLIPIFISYLGSIILIYLIFSFRFNKLLASIGTALFVGFYPFIDWSTYFLTDTIGLFFWMLQVYMIAKYLMDQKRKYLWIFGLSLIISLLNREQGVLITIALLIVLLVNKFFHLKLLNISRFRHIFLLTVVIAGAYTLVNYFLKQPSLYDSWIYLENNFVLNQNNFTLNETLNFLLNQLLILNKALISDILRHRWWSLVTILGLVGILRVFIFQKKANIIDLIIFGSSIAAYVNLIIVPFLSYRYFFPTIIGIIYFSLFALQSLIEEDQITQKVKVFTRKAKTT